MSPEAKARIGRVAMQMFRDASAVAKRGDNGAALISYAEMILESVVEEEVQRRLAARDAA